MIILFVVIFPPFPQLHIYRQILLCTCQALIFGPSYSISRIHLNSLTTAVPPITNQACLDFQAVNIAIISTHMSQSGLPDDLFSNQKSQFGKILEGL
jgi:hypothetical protein